MKLKYFRVLLAASAAALAPAIVDTLWFHKDFVTPQELDDLLRQSPKMLWEAETWDEHFIECASVASFYTLIFGLPIFALLRRFNSFNCMTSTLSGFLIAWLSVIFFTAPESHHCIFCLSASNNYNTNLPMLWGMYGALSAFVGWLVWWLLKPKNISAEV
jgi:hypothetical protein